MIDHTIPSGPTSRPPGFVGRSGGRPPKVDMRYRQRNVVEQVIARLKQHRAIATRYNKLAVSYHRLVLAALLLWLAV